MLILLLVCNQLKISLKSKKLFFCLCSKFVLSQPHNYKQRGTIITPQHNTQFNFHEFKSRVAPRYIKTIESTRLSRKNHEIDARYFNAFQQLSQKLNQLSTTTNTLLQDQSSNSETLTNLINSKEIENLKLENTELITNLNNLIINNEKLTQTINARDQTIKSLTKINDKLNNKIDALNLEINEKNKTIELINDEVLTNQIQLNVLRSKLESLER